MLTPFGTNSLQRIQATLRLVTIAPAIVGLAALLNPAHAQAEAPQSTNQASRPKIGLVLGGGGARGSAHVGVLKVLEELHIPIDYIAGNSMGAIVGGLYASGMTPDQIGHELKTIDWDDVFNDAPPRPERSFRRKRDDDLYLVKSKLGFNEGEVNFPLALIQGQKFDLQLSRLTLHAAKINDFNKLPIPFHAVAADIETGKPVVLQSGDLARSIRASMAVPGAFNPVEIDGKLLVDGLVANNVPVDVARKMGADIVIVVDVGSGLFKREQIKGALDVVGQLTNILSERNVELQLATLTQSDILIKPQLGDLGAGDFDRAGEGIDKGEQAARERLAALQRLAIDPARYQQMMAGRGIRAPAPVIEFVRLDNQSHIGDDSILSRISLKPGQPLDTAQLDAEIGTIYGLDVFESVRYEVVEADGKTGVILHAKEKSWGPNYLQFGLELADNFEGDSAYNLGVIYTKTAINPLNGEVRLGLQVGEEPGVVGEWYQPLDSGSRYFVNTKAALASTRFSVYEGDEVVSQYDIRKSGIDLAFGREFGTWGEGRIGYRWASGQSELLVGDPFLDNYEFKLGQLYARLYLDKLDNIFFPTSGNKAILELITAQEALGSDNDYNQAMLSYTHAFSWGRRNLISGFRLYSTLGDDAPPESVFRAGGFLHLSGYSPNQLSGQQAGVLSVVFNQRVLDSKILPAFLGGSIEYGNVWQQASDISFEDAQLNGSLFLGADTPIGPLYVGMGFGEGGRMSAFLHLGPVF
jgi:NTE family protein